MVLNGWGKLPVNPHTLKCGAASYWSMYYTNVLLINALIMRYIQRAPNRLNVISQTDAFWRSNSEHAVPAGQRYTYANGTYL